MVSKPVVIFGDMNVAHQAIDIARPKGKDKIPGFTI
jgi:exonuclease III